jgi:nucleoside-diphosphate-sugar epimerase
MKIVLVGGAGFIGHNLAVKLRAAHHDVTCIDSLLVNNLYSIQAQANPEYQTILHDRLTMLDVAGVPLLRMDAGDYHLLSRTLDALQPDAVVHLAAVAHLTRARKAPHQTIKDSLHTLENTLDVANNIKSRPHVVFFSSSTVYGDFEGTALEGRHVDPLSIYGAVKIAGEQIVKAYGHTFDLPTTIVRPSALYGPRCISGRVTQKFLEAAVNGGPININGDGTIRQDFTYIDDLTEGVRLVLEKPAMSDGQIFNLTAGNGRSLNDLADEVRKYYQVGVFHGENDPDKPRRGTLSVENARNRLEYAPKYQLDEGISEYVLWYKQFRRRFLQQAS